MSLPDTVLSRRRFKWLTGFLLAAILSLNTGCNLLLPFIFMGEHKEKVPAEFSKLKGKKVAIVVWAPQETLFDYPHVRMELSMHISDKIWANVKNVKIVDSRRIEDYVERTLANSVSAQEIGREFDCQMVVYLELLEFQIRDPNAPDYLRAHIDSTVTVYDIESDPEDPKRYDLAEVYTIFRNRSRNCSALPMR